MSVLAHQHSMETTDWEGSDEPSSSEHTDDPWWPQLLAVIARSNELNALRSGLEGELESAGGTEGDWRVEELIFEIIAFSQDCDWYRANWQHMWEGERADAVLGLQYTADNLEADTASH